MIPILGIEIVIRKMTAPIMYWTKLRVRSTLRQIGGHAWQCPGVIIEFGIQWQWYWLELRDSQMFMVIFNAFWFTTGCWDENDSMCRSDMVATVATSSTALVLCNKLTFRQGGRQVLEMPDARSGWWWRLNSVQQSYGIDCQSAMSIRPSMEKHIPRIVIMRLFNLIDCIKRLWTKRNDWFDFRRKYTTECKLRMQQ